MSFLKIGEDTKMTDSWMTAERIKATYGDRFSDVAVDSPYLVALNRPDSCAFVGIGGDIPLKSEELEEKFLDSYLQNVGSLDESAIRFFRSDESPLELVTPCGVVEPFRFVIGMVHPIGKGYSDQCDFDQLVAAAAPIPELRSVKVASFLPLASPGVLPGAHSVQYSGITVGNLPDQFEDGQRVCSMRTTGFSLR